MGVLRGGQGPTGMGARDGLGSAARASRGRRVCVRPGGWPAPAPAPAATHLRRACVQPTRARTACSHSMQSRQGRAGQKQGRAPTSFFCAAAPASPLEGTPAAAASSASPRSLSLREGRSPRSCSSLSPRPRSSLSLRRKQEEALQRHPWPTRGTTEGEPLPAFWTGRRACSERCRGPAQGYQPRHLKAVGHSPPAGPAPPRGSKHARLDVRGNAPAAHLRRSSSLRSRSRSRSRLRSRRRSRSRSSPRRSRSR